MQTYLSQTDLYTAEHLFILNYIYTKVDKSNDEKPESLSRSSPMQCIQISKGPYLLITSDKIRLASPATQFTSVVYFSFGRIPTYMKYFNTV